MRVSSAAVSTTGEDAGAPPPGDVEEEGDDDDDEDPDADAAESRATTDSATAAAASTRAARARPFHSRVAAWTCADADVVGRTSRFATATSRAVS